MCVANYVKSIMFCVLIVLLILQDADHEKIQELIKDSLVITSKENSIWDWDIIAAVLKVSIVVHTIFLLATCNNDSIFYLQVANFSSELMYKNNSSKRIISLKKCI